MSENPAERFAAFIDREDFASAGALLDDRCVYYVDGECLEGRDRIVAALRDGGTRARKVFDRTIYGHSVEEIGPGEFVVVYLDSIRHRDEAFVHKSKQKLALNRFGRIDLIIQHEIPGEEEKLKAYMRAME